MRIPFNGESICGGVCQSQSSEGLRRGLAGPAGQRAKAKYRKTTGGEKLFNSLQIDIEEHEKVQ